MLETGLVLTPIGPVVAWCTERMAQAGHEADQLVA